MSTATAIGYLRVSTKDQADDGVSLDAQLERIKAFCKMNGYTLTKVYRDEGLSGKRSDNRPGLQAALDHACQDKAILVIYSLSRMSRSVRDTLEIAERINHAGANLCSLTESFDTSTATGRMVFKLLAVFAEFEREILGERTSAAMQHKLNQGERVGRHAQFGYRLTSSGGLEQVPEEMGVVTLARGKRSEGLDCKQIAGWLNAKGLTFRGRLWRTSQVEALLLREDV
jgi:site-specific DNA recombinase